MYFLPFQMSTNSSFDTHPLLLFNLSSTNSSTTSGTHCFTTTESVAAFAAFFFTQCVLILPISLVVFSFGLKRWFQGCFDSKPSTERHSDAFIYHMAALEIVVVPGSMLILYGLFQNQRNHMSSGYNIYGFGWYGETFFYLLTCIEHYLAVVHPVTYRNLQKERKIRIRNITAGCVWLFNLGKVILALLGFYFYWFELFIIGFLLVSLCFSSLSVLSVLISLVVEEHGKKRNSNRSKQKAYYTILVIQSVLLLRCVIGLTFVLYSNVDVGFDCFFLYTLWLNLPCSLTLQLFFLQRMRKSTWYSNKTSKN